MVPLKKLDAPKFYNCQLWEPSFQILAKTLYDDDDDDDFCLCISGLGKMLVIVVGIQCR